MKANFFLRFLFSAILTLFVSISQPSKAAWLLNGPLNMPRYEHTATLLPNGEILVAGGVLTNGATTVTVELYDPVSGACTLTASMANARSRHTATMLPNGKVLIAGGSQGFTVLASCELYDPISGTWTNTGSLNVGRFNHTATLLSNGKVLVAGGGTSAATAAAELYDYTTGHWSTVPSMTTARTLHCATLLTNGQVLVSGGQQGTIPITILSSAELYDPVSNVWFATGSMANARVSHTAVMLPSGNAALAGKVLVAGGDNSSSILSACELYTPSTGTWGTTVAMHTPRDTFTASVLPNGDVLVTGGHANSGTDASTNTSEIYVVTGGSASWSTPAKMNAQRMNQTATLLPSGKVALIGGVAPNVTPDGTTESLYNTSGDWTSGATTVAHASGQAATLLANGKVFVTGGYDSSGNNDGTAADLYDPSTGAWQPINPMTHTHVFHTSTLLQNGNVLVTGDDENDFTSEAELYNTALGTWTDLGPGEPYAEYSATLLLNGKILFAGGLEGPDFEATVVNNCFLYDPVSQTFSPTGSLNTPRCLHSATLLANGQVLVAGGLEYDYDNELFFSGQDCELYDPNTGQWSYTGSMAAPRENHSAILLPNGQVLAAGGINYNVGVNSTAELFNPATGLWTTTGSLNTSRADSAATLLPGGQVLMASGYSGATTNGQTTSAEIYDPGAGVWTGVSSMTQARFDPSGVLLPGGQFFVVGGDPTSTGGTVFPELFDAWTAISATRVPQISSTNSVLNIGNSLTLNGTLFRDLTSGSGGNNGADSPTDYPLVQLRNIETRQTLMLNEASWDTNAFVSVPVTNFPSGYAMATIFVNGIPSQSGILDVVQTQTATVTISNLLQYFDTTAKSVTVTTVPSGLAVNVTYNGSASPPTNVGSYTVVATVNDPVYSGSATNTLQIELLRNFGVDASHFQNSNGIPETNWAQMYAQGLRFAFIKATEGLTGANDPTMAVNVSNALQVGLLVGVYHYAHPENRPTTNGAVQEADNLLSYAGTAIGPGMLRPVLDMETTSTNLPPAAMTDWVLAFLQEVVNNRGAGAEPIIYCTSSYAGTEFDSRLAGNSLWVEGGGGSELTGGPSSTGIFTNWSFWQYNLSGSAGGISPIDLDVCHDDFQPLSSYLIPGLSGTFVIESVSADSGGIHLSLTNVPGLSFTILTSTNVLTPRTNWTVLGTTTETSPGFYQFTDPQRTNFPQRFYRLRWP